MGYKMNLAPVLRQRYFDANGNPLAGGLLYTYQAGTTTPQATYTDQGGGTPSANPIVLDANGEASMWLDPELSYKFVLKNSSDVTQWTVDNVVGLITADSVGTVSLQDLSVTTPKVANDAIDADKLKDSADTDADRAVTTNHVRDGAITAPKLGANSVTGAKLNSDVVDDSTLQYSSSQISIKDGGVTQAKMATRTTTTDGTDPGSGGVSISSVNASYENTTTSDTDIATTTITTTGRPVLLLLQSTSAPSIGHVRSARTSAGVNTFSRVSFYRDSTAIGVQEFGFSVSGSSGVTPYIEIPTSAFLMIDTPIAGTYTYKASGRLFTGNELLIENVKLLAIEL